MNYAKVILLGRIGTPEVKANQKGETFIRFGIAINGKAKNGAETTDWHNCVLGGKHAEVMAPILTKGMLVHIDGRPAVQKGDDGKVYQTIFVNDLQICSSKEQKAAATSASAPAAAPAAAATTDDTTDDDIPF